MVMVLFTGTHNSEGAGLIGGCMSGGGGGAVAEEADGVEDEGQLETEEERGDQEEVALQTMFGESHSRPLQNR